jgi:hypothetical protein
MTSGERRAISQMSVRRGAWREGSRIAVAAVEARATTLKVTTEPRSRPARRAAPSGPKGLDAGGAGPATHPTMIAVGSSAADIGDHASASRALWSDLLSPPALAELDPWRVQAPAHRRRPCAKFIAGGAAVLRSPQTVRGPFVFVRRSRAARTSRSV